MSYFKFQLWVLLSSVSLIPLSIWPQIFPFWCFSWFIIILGAFVYKIMAKPRYMPVKYNAEPEKAKTVPDYDKINKWATHKVRDWPGGNPSIYAFGRNTDDDKRSNLFELLEELRYPRIVSWDTDVESGGSSTYIIIVSLLNGQTLNPFCWSGIVLTQNLISRPLIRYSLNYKTLNNYAWALSLTKPAVISVWKKIPTITS